jgi:hypothetical protein
MIIRTLTALSSKFHKFRLSFLVNGIQEKLSEGGSGMGLFQDQRAHVEVSVDVYYTDFYVEGGKKRESVWETLVV